MAGVGQTGIWRTGVWVEPLDAYGDFELHSTGELEWSGRFSYGGSFDLDGSAVLLWSGHNTYRGTFQLVADGVLAFEGNKIDVSGQGTWTTKATARLFVAWVPDLGPPGGVVDPAPTAGDVGCIVGPGDAYVFGGVAGTVIRDATGRLVVVDQNGEVMCILGPGGVELP